jgi:SnoaL-like protein
LCDNGRPLLQLAKTIRIAYLTKRVKGYTIILIRFVSQ